MPDLISAGRVSRFRWVICALLFFAITVNYVDRMVFGIVAPELQKIFGWQNADIPSIAFWFEVAYTIGLTLVGRLLDRVGTRLGLALALLGWSVAAIFHAAMASALGFKIARFLLGLTESAAFPGATKAAAEWFPRRERVLATGIVNAGANVGAILAPLAVPWLFFTYGWQWAFVATGAIGLIWLFFWWALYRLPQHHPRVSPGELALIHSDPPDEITETMSWRQILTTRQAWAFILGKFLTDAVWRWNLYLLPFFFSQHFHLDIRKFGLPLLVIYLMSDVASVVGGWVSYHLVRPGWTLNRSRKLGLLIGALGVVPIAFVTRVENMWLAVALVGLAASGHQMWSLNIFTTASDMFPKHAVGTVVGLGGTAGGLGAMGLLALTSFLFKAAGSGDTDQVYSTLFLIASLVYLLSWVAFHLCVPRMLPVRKATA